MYKSNEKLSKHRVLPRFILYVVLIAILIFLLAWYIFFRDNSNSSANFYGVSTKTAVTEPVYKDFSNQYFKISLPNTWADLGLKNPYADQVYYEFQNTQKNFDNRWIRVYVDIFPPKFPINRLLPISIVDNKVVAGTVSEECNTFEGAPLPKNAQQQAVQTWDTQYNNANFVCDMANPRNYVGTASPEQGYGTTLVSKDGSAHKYFFVYIDHNIRPEYSTFSGALRSFETK